MNKEGYCSNCETDSSTEPNFNCNTCCCQKCRYKKCQCSNKQVSIVTSQKTFPILSSYYCDKCNIYNTTEECNECVLKKKMKSLYCINCHNDGSNEPNFICKICYCQRCSKKNTECKCEKVTKYGLYVTKCERCHTKSYTDTECKCRFCNVCKEYTTPYRWSLSKNCCYACYEQNICFCFSHKYGHCYNCKYGEFLY